MDEPIDLEPDKLDALKRLSGKARFKLDSEHRALVEEMAKKYNIPLSGKPTEFTDAAKTAALPMLGQIAGGAAGGMSGNPALIIAGEMAGGVIGTKANEMFGISKPDETDYLLAVGVPPGAAGIGKLGRALVPGHAAGEQTIGVEKIKQLPSLIGGSKAATDIAYEQVGNTPLPTTNFAKTVEQLLTTEGVAKKYGEAYPHLTKSLKATADTIAANPQGIPMKEVNTLLKRYRERVDSLEAGGGEGFGAYKALRKGLFDDMAAASKGAVGQDAVLLRQAMNEARKRIATDELTETITQRGVKTQTMLGQTFETINPTAVLERLRRIGFEDSVGKEQFGKISTMLKELAKIPQPSQALRTGIGTEGRAIGMLGAGMIGAAAGGAMGGFTGGLGGGAMTALTALGAIKVHDAVARLAMSDTGRSFLVKLFKHNEGRIGQQTAAVLQFAASQFQDTGDTNPAREAMAEGMVKASEMGQDVARRLQLGIPRGTNPQLELP